MAKRKDDWIPKEQRTHLKCKGCKKKLSKDQFVLGGKSASGLQQYSARCKPCYNIHATKYDNSIILKEYIDTIKIECGKCGYNKCNAALEFHHAKPATKEHAISEMVRNRSSLSNIKKEISKCVLLCANLP